MGATVLTEGTAVEAGLDPARLDRIRERGFPGAGRAINRYTLRTGIKHCVLSGPPKP